jgi:hypothetical protein
MACAAARNVIVYGLLPLCAFPVAFYGLSFLIEQERTFKGYTATSCAIGSMIIWLGWAAFVWLQPPHPHHGCGFGGPELVFPFPFFEILVLDTLGQSWAAYKICTDQSGLSLISLLRKWTSR